MDSEESALDGGCLLATISGGIDTRPGFEEGKNGHRTMKNGKRKGNGGAPPPPSAVVVIFKRKFVRPLFGTYRMRESEPRGGVGVSRQGNQPRVETDLARSAGSQLNQDKNASSIKPGGL